MDIAKVFAIQKRDDEFLKVLRVIWTKETDGKETRRDFDHSTNEERRRRGGVFVASGGSWSWWTPTI